MQEEKTKKKIGLSSEAMEDIAQRLSKLENLYFPRALQPSSSSPSQCKSLLRDLLLEDRVLFLEDYVLGTTTLISLSTRMYRERGGGGSRSEMGPVDRKRINDALDKHLERSSPSTSSGLLSTMRLWHPSTS
ncbi:putative casein kinase II subunit beta-4 [Camellia lanceoleosa]|uniref:Casein kinase II subunit beta-4 n=1 Tax=Camellia lanceoleosa TaxID=1840588 RepID=A0ACC0F8R3_9ERIC|nr:putative casein kinase II subunit beta-4 [Camellia lanceoleosa]